MGLRQGVCVLVLDINHKCVVVTRPDGHGVCLPGGKVEPQEDVHAAACRELWEETGLHVLPNDLIFVYRGDCETVLLHPNNTALNTVDAEMLGVSLREEGADIPQAKSTEVFDVSTFLAVSWRGVIAQQETNVVPHWANASVLLSNSPFASYNTAALQALRAKLPSIGTQVLPP